MLSPVEQIKSRLGIVDVVSSYLHLEKAGSNFKARCPFHNEKTPSFFVSPDRGTYHCFGCNKGGDIFEFVKEMEGLDFSGALHTLAEKAQIELRPFEREKRSSREKLFLLLEDAVSFFRAELAKNTSALRYLKKRGLSQEMLNSFSLGFAPDEYGSVLHYLREKGYTDDVITQSGLVISPPGSGRSGYYDRFRSRIMFPLSDASGRVIGFSGRIFPKEKEDGVGKYINTPETEVYSKSKVLYGLHRAKEAFRKKGYAIVLEGQMDLLLAHQVGHENTVAVSGTALTVEHLRTLKRFTDTLVFAFDGDRAGLQATLRAARMALRLGFQVKAASLSDGLDPADCILHSPDVWRESIEGAKFIVPFFLTVYTGTYRDHREYTRHVSRDVFPLLDAFISKVEQSHFITETAKSLGVGEEMVREDMKRVIREEGSSKEKEPEEGITREERTRKEMIAQRAYGVAFWQESLNNSDIARMVLGRLESVLGGREFSDEDREALIFEAEAFFGEGEGIEGNIEELFLNLEREILKEELGTALRELSLAKAMHDGEKETLLFRKCNEISHSIDLINRKNI